MSDDHTLCCQFSEPNTVEIFDKGSFTRRIVIFGSLISVIFSLGILFTGVGIWIISLSQHRAHGLMYFTCHAPHEVLSIGLNVVVTFCTECAGVMHSTSLRFALFQEYRAQYNSNLRLLTGSDEKSMNSAAINAIMTILLILSYASSSFFYQQIFDYDSGILECGVQAIPAIVLGICMLLQTCISLFALRNAQILTWSTSPCDTIPALLSMHDHRSLEKYYSFPDSYACSRTSLDRQPSAWDTRRGVRVSGTWVWRFVPNPYPSWQFIPSELAQASVGDSVGGDATSFTTWFSLYAVMVVTQGGLTFGLHCAELVAGVIRDERLWRRRVPKGGTNSSSRSWLYAFCLDNWLYAVLLFAKPILPLGLLVVAVVFTLAARHHPKGAQPVTYGHIKTILHLMDSEVLGDKDGGPCHVGTSKEPLLDGNEDDDGCIDDDSVDAIACIHERCAEIQWFIRLRFD
ncbi:hypothetical protein DEU56DRAFT_758577 [Suillus clintonianus]|uniref:uncharacterized protein n=1 Tax=Suillus clintonianus TaxID=1904413 RepID=UPI001B87F16F|nr:uncharacterized protein DEU56DRAFT_758577 [Suillus clintonianus]KAG2127691.1 hypothetical protein DEU56DRAFT_758577 [Suillus clintonianus]